MLKYSISFNAIALAKLSPCRLGPVSLSQLQGVLSELISGCGDFSQVTISAQGMPILKLMNKFDATELLVW